LKERVVFRNGEVRGFATWEEAASPVFASTGSTFVRIAVKGKRRRLPAQAQGRDELRHGGFRRKKVCQKEIWKEEKRGETHQT
jgi:hypothetical protein